MHMPSFEELMNPTLEGLERLGGSGSIREIYDQVVQLLNLPDDIISIPYNSEKSNQTMLDYRMAWARSYLKYAGLITNSSRGVWSLTSAYSMGMKVDPVEVKQKSRALSRNRNSRQPAGKYAHPNDLQAIIEKAELSWRDSLHEQLQALAPDAFERLTKRVLRESGFVQVEVTGKTGDGGIDGKGIVKIQGILSYHVVFQCKRYKNTVGSGDIRDFRGAMVGRADKGLFVTTGTFSPSAREEAIRAGTSPIDLVDGDGLVDMLKDLRLGVDVEMVEDVKVNKDWFKDI